MERKRNDKGQFETQYDWPVLIPKICSEFMNGASLGTICTQPGYPTPWAVWYAIKHNPEYKREWRSALRAQMYLLDGEFDRIAEICKEAFADKQINTVAIRVWLDTLILKYSNLERAYEKYGMVKRRWTGQEEQSLDDVMRAARKRAWGDSGPKPRKHNENTRCVE